MDKFKEPVQIDDDFAIKEFKRKIIQDLGDKRELHCDEMNTALKQVGKATLEGGEIKTFSQTYYEAKGKVMIIDELLEKIASEK